MSDRDRDARVSTTRRRLLSALAGSTVAGVAGCETARSEVTGSSAILGHSFPYITQNVQLNPWATSYPFQFTPVIFEYLGVSAPGEPWRRSDLLEAVEIDGDVVTVRFDDRFSWWNGEPVTARDRWIAHRIDELRGKGTRTSLTLLDRYTLRYDLDRPLDRPFVFSKFLDGVLNTADWLFDRWYEKLVDAGTGTRRETVAKDLRNWGISLETAAERGFGCGPYEFSEVSPNRLMLKRFEDHPRAADLPVSRLWFPVTKGRRAEDLRKEGWLDAGRGLLDNDAISTPDHIEQLAEFPSTGGTKIAVNWNNPHLARRGVRRAILCALPLATLVRNGGWGRTASLQTGMTYPSERRWLDAKLRDRLRRYPIEADTDRATAYMSEAGYERRGGRWIGPDGRTATLHVQSPRWSNWASTSNLIKDALDPFGFKLTVEHISNTSLLSIVDRGEYDLLLWWTDGRPQKAYDVTATTPSSLGPGVSDSTSDSPIPVRPSIPTEPGSDANSRRIDLHEQWRRIRRPTPPAETREAVSLFARWWNYDVPHIDLATTVTGVWGNTRDFAWPEAGDDAFRVSGPANRPEYYLLKTGRIRPVESA